MTYYIQDTSTAKYAHFNTVPELVTYLEGMIQRTHNVTRSKYMQNLVELGYGYDDPTGVTFTRAMADEFNLGVIRDGKYVKTDVHLVNRFAQKEFGN